MALQAGDEAFAAAGAAGVGAGAQLLGPFVVGARALDHGWASACVTSPARTGLVST